MRRAPERFSPTWEDEGEAEKSSSGSESESESDGQPDEMEEYILQHRKCMRPFIKKLRKRIGDITRRDIQEQIAADALTAEGGDDEADPDFAEMDIEEDDGESKDGSEYDSDDEGSEAEDFEDAAEELVDAAERMRLHCPSGECGQRMCTKDGMLRLFRELDVM